MLSVDSRRYYHLIAIFSFIFSLFIVARHYAYYLADDYPVLADRLARIDFTDYFFCCSGFTALLSARRHGFHMLSAVKNRLRRLYPLHILIIVYYGVAVLLFDQRSALHSVGSFPACAVPQALLLHSVGATTDHCLNYPSWYLSALFLLTLAMPAFMCLLDRFGVRALVVLALATVAALEAVSAYIGNHWTHWSYGFGVLRGLPSFVLGMVIAERIEPVSRIVGRYPIAYGAAALSLAAMIVGLAPTLFQIGLQIVVVAALAGAEARGAASIFDGAPMRRLATLPFYVYMLHVPVASLAISFVAVKGLGLGGPPLLMAVVATGAGVVVLAAATDRLTDFAGRLLFHRPRSSARLGR